MLDDDGRSVERREDVRDAASIVAMCELAAELAGGGDLEQLRSQLAQVRMVEQPPGIEEAEAAALALERVVGAHPGSPRPRTSTTSARRRLALEQALGELASPFSQALRGSTGAVEAFVRDVERGYLADLR